MPGAIWPLYLRAWPATHSCHQGARYPHRVRRFESRYLDGNDPARIKIGIADLPNWVIRIDLNDPDLENRSLVRRLINLPLDDDEESRRVLNKEFASPMRRLTYAVTAQALTDSYRQYAISRPDGDMFVVEFCGPEVSREAMKIPRLDTRSSPRTLFALDLSFTSA